MHIAFESPTPLIRNLAALTDYDFVLAHKVCTDSAYAECYSDREPGRISILDNGVNELGKPVSLNELFEAADIIKPDIIVSPDMVNDCKATISNFNNFVMQDPPCAVMGVVQGNTVEECLECAEVFASYDRLFCIGVPYTVMCSNKASVVEMGESRLKVVDALIQRFAFPIHLLGTSDLAELKVYQKALYHQIISIDTGLPILYGMLGMRLGRDPLMSKEVATYNKVQALKDAAFEEHLDDIYYNIAYLRKLTILV